MKIIYRNGTVVTFNPLAHGPMNFLRVLWTGKRIDRKYGPAVMLRAAMKDGQE